MAQQPIGVDPVKLHEHLTQMAMERFDHRFAGIEATELELREQMDAVREIVARHRDERRDGMTALDKKLDLFEVSVKAQFKALDTRVKQIAWVFTLVGGGVIMALVGAMMNVLLKK